MSATASLEDLVRSSQFRWGLLAGVGAAALTRTTATLIDRIRPIGRPGNQRWARSVYVAAAPMLAVSGWLIGERAGLRGWLPLTAVVCLMVLGTPLIARFDSDFADGRLTALALTVSAGGIWACIPDTELARGALGGGLAATVFWLIGARRRLGWLAVAVSCGGLAATIASGARGRPSATIGAVMCLSFLSLLPAVQAGLARWKRCVAPVPVLAALDLIAVTLSSRWVGLLRSARSAVAAGVVLVLVEVAGLIVTSRPDLAIRAGHRSEIGPSSGRSAK